MDQDDLLEIGLNRAVDLLATRQKSAGALGEHPDGGEVHPKAGRFGPYVEHIKLRATLPRGTDMTAVDLTRPLRFLRAKAAKPATKKKVEERRHAQERHRQKGSYPQGCGEEGGL